MRYELTSFSLVLVVVTGGGVCVTGGSFLVEEQPYLQEVTVIVDVVKYVEICVP